MTEKSRFIRHVFGGGFASDFGSDAETLAVEENTVLLPYLIEADNVIYNLDGGPIKAPGVTKLNSLELENAAIIRGIFDCWFSGSLGSSTQHRIIHVGSTVKKDDADANFIDLFTGLEEDKIPSYAMLEDLLVIASDSNTDVPKSWDGTTAQNLAGSPPNFAFVVEHANRLWAGGAASNPSRLYYSASLNPEDWIGQGSGKIDISPSDGDVLTGLASHKDALIVFKGPYKGSIHIISGTSPANFSRGTLVKGVGCGGHNTIFRFGDDLGFMWSDGSIHSLSATASHGDFTQGALSQPISRWLRDNLNLDRIKRFWAVNNEEFGHILFSIAANSNIENNYTLAMDYRFNPPRWSRWPAYESACLNSVVDPTLNNRRIVMAGSKDGFVRKYNQASNNIDGTVAVEYKVTTPFINYGSAINVKTLNVASLSLVRKNASTINFGWKRDENIQQTISFSQTQADVLDTFVLGTSVLGGENIIDVFEDLPEGGEFHSIQYEMSVLGLGDVEIHGFGVGMDTGGWDIE